MNAFRATGRKFFETKVPKLTDGVIEWVKVPCGTMDSRTASKMDEMVAFLGPEGAHAWDVLATVTEKPQRWTLSQLYARWSTVPSTKTDRNGKALPPSNHQRLAAVREQVQDVDVEPYVELFYTVLTGPSAGVSVDTAKHYRAAVRLFIAKGEPFPRSRLSERELRVWIEEMDDVEPGTVRKRGIGMRRFAAWLVGRGVLGMNPMERITLPPQGDPLTHYIELPDVMRLADSLSGQMRHLEYVLPATALEVSTALAVRVRAVSTLDKEIHAPGTKTAARDRVLRVADFGWDAVRELMKGKHPDSLLFDEIRDRWAAGDAHLDAVDALGEKGHRVFVEWKGEAKRYTMRDHRHTWAVRAARSGMPPAGMAQQLGHSDGGVLALKVYGQFFPKKEERDRWEAMATARDESVKRAGEEK